MSEANCRRMKRNKFRRRACLFLLASAVIVAVTICVTSTVVHRRLKFMAFHFNPLDWYQDQYPACSGNFIGYGHEFALLKNVAIEPDGKEIFYFNCKQEYPKYEFDYGKEGTHLNSWMKSLQKFVESKYVKNEYMQIFTVAVLRYEYANLYHTMTDWYNVFLIMKYFNLSQKNISVLLLDQSAPGGLDDTWSALFGNVVFKKNIREPVVYSHLVWGILGYESPMNMHHLTSLPYVDEFHKFFLQRHDIEHAKTLDCKKLSVLFIWRRNYVAHPGNPSGEVNRKVQNEQELITSARAALKGHIVQGIQADKYSMKEQLDFVSKADILISMHGAALSLILFLPSHAGVIELFPLYWKKFGFYHFYAMARWRGVKYKSWQNFNPGLEYPQHYTYIPPLSITNLILDHKADMCG